MSHFQIGEGYAIVQCEDCGRVLGMHMNADKGEERTKEIMCLPCLHEGCDEK